jgi:hypothetical protein
MRVIRSGRSWVLADFGSGSEFTSVRSSSRKPTRRRPLMGRRVFGTGAGKAVPSGTEIGDRAEANAAPTPHLPKVWPGLLPAVL